MSIPISQSIPTPTLPTLVSMFVFYVWVSFSALQVSSSIPFFYIPHVCVNIYLFFSEHVILQPEVGVGGIWQCLESFWNVVTCEGVLLVSSWQRSDAVNTLRWTGQLLPSPTKNYPIQNVSRATVEESFASAMDVKLWIRRLCSFLTLPRIHLHLTSVTMLCLSKEFLFEKTCCDRELPVSKGSSLMEICRQAGENLGCREFSWWLQEAPAGRPPLCSVTLTKTSQSHGLSPVLRIFMPLQGPAAPLCGPTSPSVPKPPACSPHPMKSPPLGLPALGHPSPAPLKISSFSSLEAAHRVRLWSPIITLFCQCPSATKPLFMPI